MSTGPHRVASETAIIEKERDKRIIEFLPRALNITWGNDDRYWRIIDSDTASVAELKQVSWLEVTCSTDNVEVGKKYKVGFDISLTADAFGWNEIDVYVMAKVGKSGKYTSKKVCLGDKPTNEDLTIPEQPLEMTVTQEGKAIYFGLYEVWSSKWKGGLLIYKAFCREV